jgi:hypothetical protein
MDNITMIRIIAGLLAVVFGVLFYFLPSFIARRKRNARAIFLLNLLAGWTAVGWVAALIWALVNDGLPVVVVQQPAPAILCSTCGRYSSPGAQFCQNCGQSVVCTVPVGTANRGA